MKKLLRISFLVAILTFVLVLGTLFSPATTHAAIYTETHDQVFVKPNASGGGCNDGTSGPSGGVIGIRPCISYFSLWNVNTVSPDNYLTFGFSTPYFWTTCTVTTNFYKNGYYIRTNSDSCLQAARSNGTSVHFGPYDYKNPPKGDYSSTVCVKGTYNGFAESTCESSPHEYV